MKTEFDIFYDGPNGNSKVEKNVLAMTCHTFPKEYAKIFWKQALKYSLALQQHTNESKFRIIIREEIKNLEEE